MINDVIENGFLTKLDNIIQWQERDVHQRESVSQHSYKVVIMTRILLEEVLPCNTEEVLVFKQRVVDYAMFHDWDEALITRDISHDTKYNDYNGVEIRETLNKLVEHLATYHFPPVNEVGHLLYDNIVKPESDVHLFVKMADWLSMFYFCVREVKMGNVGFITSYSSVKYHTIEVIEEVIKFVKDTFNTYDLKPLVNLITYVKEK